MAGNRPASRSTFRAHPATWALLLGRQFARLGAWLPLARGGAPDESAAPRTLVLFLLLFTGGMVLISLLGDQGLIAYRRLQDQAVRLRGEVAQLQANRRGLNRRIQALREDSAYIELVARRRLGLVRPGETIVQLPRTRERP